MTPQELAKIEAATAARNARHERADRPGDFDKGDRVTKAGHLDECQSGAQGAACGYNAGWTDPGDKVMRVAASRAPRSSPLRPTGESAASLRPGDCRARGVAAAVAARQNDNPEGRSLGERCIMSFGSSSGPIMQSQLYNNTYQLSCRPRTTSPSGWRWSTTCASCG